MFSSIFAWFRKSHSDLSQIKGLTPIVIGVTGHRNVASDDATLCALVRSECEQFAKAYPHSPFLIVSALAEGADRLVARVALETLPNSSLIAVLPMPVAEYEKDFASEASRTEFHALLARSVGQLESDPKGEDWKSYGEPRNILYAKAGATVAEQAQILFALWDGEAKRGTGGTADVVHWFQQGYPPRGYSEFGEQVSPLDPPEPGKLIIITPSTGTLRREIVNKADGTPSSIEAILKRTDTYNRIIASDAKNGRSNDYKLLPGLNNNGTAEQKQEAQRLCPCAPNVLAVYDAADAAATRYATLVRFLDKVMYSLAVIAFVMFAFMEKVPLSAWAYLALAGVMWAIWRGVMWTGIDNRFLEYRGLAEAMRVVFFWRLAGIKRAAWLSYLPQHSGAIVWVRHAVRAVEFRENATVEGDAGDEGLAATRRYWVEGQKAFFTNRISRLSASIRRWRGISLWSLRVSYIAAIVLSCLVIYVVVNGQSLWSWGAATEFTLPLLQWRTSGQEVLQFLLGISAAIGIAVRGYLYRKADEDLLKQYDAAAQVFTIADKELREHDKAQQENRPTDWEPAKILEDTGRQALTEHGQWLVLRHSRPFEMPK